MRIKGRPGFTIAVFNEKELSAFAGRSNAAGKINSEEFVFMRRQLKARYLQVVHVFANFNRLNPTRSPVLGTGVEVPFQVAHDMARSQTIPNVIDHISLVRTIEAHQSPFVIVSACCPRVVYIGSTKIVEEFMKVNTQVRLIETRLFGNDNGSIYKHTIKSAIDAAR